MFQWEKSSKYESKQALTNDVFWNLTEKEKEDIYNTITPSFRKSIYTATKHQKPKMQTPSIKHNTFYLQTTKVFDRITLE